MLSIKTFNLQLLNKYQIFMTLLGKKIIKVYIIYELLNKMKKKNKMILVWHVLANINV